jgi:hypothetical protein
MTEHYTFTTTLPGLRLALHLMLSLRAQGFTTMGILGPVERFGRLNNRLLHVEATPAVRPNRQARGCSLGGN